MALGTTGCLKKSVVERTGRTTLGEIQGGSEAMD